MKIRDNFKLLLLLQVISEDIIGAKCHTQKKKNNVGEEVDTSDVSFLLTGR